MKKFRSFCFLFLLGSCFFTANGQVDIVLSDEQVKFINELKIEKIEDFTKEPSNLHIEEYIFPQIKNGKFTMVTTSNIPTNKFSGLVPDTMIVVFQDSLVVSSYKSPRWSEPSMPPRTYEYNEKKQLKKYGNNDIQYYENGAPKFFQWGSRSKEYIYKDNCITEVFYTRGEKIMEQTTHCFNDAHQIVKDSTWYAPTKDSIPILIMGYILTDFKYEANRLIQARKISYRDKEARLKMGSKPLPEGEDQQLHKKYMKIDTTWSYTTNFSYDDLGLLTNRKITGFNHNGQNLDKEAIAEQIVNHYEFESTKPLVLKISKSNNALPVGVTMLTFNDAGRLIKMKYDGYSGKSTSGNKFTRMREFYYEIE